MLTPEQRKALFTQHHYKEQVPHCEKCGKSIASGYLCSGCKYDQDLVVKRIDQAEKEIDELIGYRPQRSFKESSGYNASALVPILGWCVRQIRQVSKESGIKPERHGRQARWSEDEKNQLLHYKKAQSGNIVNVLYDSSSMKFLISTSYAVTVLEQNGGKRYSPEWLNALGCSGVWGSFTMSGRRWHEIQGMATHFLGSAYSAAVQAQLLSSPYQAIPPSAVNVELTHPNR